MLAASFRQVCFFTSIIQWETWIFQNLLNSDRQLAKVPPSGENTYCCNNKALALIVTLHILYYKQLFLEYLQN